MLFRSRDVLSDNAKVASATPANRLPIAPTGRRMQSTVELRSQLESSLAQRSMLLRATFAEGSPDALALIESIVHPAECVIRRVPITAQRTLAVARDANASTEQLVQAMSNDPVLARGLLRLANSAAYAAITIAPCVSIVDAVLRVGAAGVESVVLRCMIEGMFSQPGGEFQAMSDKVWAHMVRTAPIGRTLSTLFDTNQDDAFLLAMMHDVGKLVIFDRIAALRPALRHRVTFPVPFVSAVLRLVHEPLGGLAALEWGLGETAAGAIASHHRHEVFAVSDRASQLLFVAEATDIARSAGVSLETDALVATGALSVNPQALQAAIGAY